MVGADLAMIHAAHLPEGLSIATSGGVAGDALAMLRRNAERFAEELALAELDGLVPDAR